ncbi:MAG TPA: hypothetical protein VM537_33915 [Anaerolineae bacterium]|nr:hypothetical protein [Anaerolineae bacterium]
MAFSTPFSHPSNVLVMEPGGYTFGDYVRVGFPLAALSLLSISAALVVAY